MEDVFCISGLDHADFLDSVISLPRSSLSLPTWRSFVFGFLLFPKYSVFNLLSFANLLSSSASLSAGVAGGSLGGELAVVLYVLSALEVGFGFCCKTR